MLKNKYEVWCLKDREQYIQTSLKDPHEQLP